MSSGPAPSSRTGLLGLALTLFLFLVVGIVVDLLRPDSFLRSAWDALFGSGSFSRTFFRDLGRSWPRW